MRAIVASSYGGPEILLAGEVARPVPAPDQILVQVAACGVCGHDLLAARGLAVDDRVVLTHALS